MTARILDGKLIATELRREIAAWSDRLRGRGVLPGLGVLLVGDDPASRSYVTAKERACEELGLHSAEIHLSASASKREILDVVRRLNDDPTIHGILVQLPLPDASIEREVLESMDPDKDVDGFHPMNVGRLMLGLPTFLPCTPHGVLQILHRSGIPVAGRHVVVVGRSHIVGRPLANLLSFKNAMGNATVTLCHTGTKDLGHFTRMADILVAAVGRANAITGGMIAEGAVVIDVGVNRVADPAHARGYRLAGDVDFTAAKERAAAITPVPGGVGPMTIAMLMYNVLQAAARAAGAE